MKGAAEKLMALGPQAVLVKGGHLVEEAEDVLYDGRDFHLFKGERIETENTHGTGCTLSSAIAAELAKGHTVLAVAGTAVGAAGAGLGGSTAKAVFTRAQSSAAHRTRQAIAYFPVTSWPSFHAVSDWPTAAVSFSSGWSLLASIEGSRPSVACSRLAAVLTCASAW